MAELLKIEVSGKIKSVEEFPFQDEVADFQPFIKQNLKVLGENVELLAEQVDIGIGRVDMILVDRLATIGDIVVAELKAQAADLTVLLQVLRYAAWLKNHPDTLAKLCLERNIATKDVDLTTVKIAIVAPLITAELIELSQYITAFEFRFIEVKRFRSADETFALIDRKMVSISPVSPVRTMEEWSWEKYQSDLGYSLNRIEIGRALLDQAFGLCAERGWSLTQKFRKGYVALQLGYRNVFAVDFWFPVKSCHFWFRLPKSPEQLGLKDPFPELKGRWDKQFDCYRVPVSLADIDLARYGEFFEQAYQYAGGKVGATSESEE